MGACIAQEDGDVRSHRGFPKKTGQTGQVLCKRLEEHGAVLVTSASVKDSWATCHLLGGEVHMCDHMCVCQKAACAERV